jgi:hypothetical protein
MTTFGKPVHRVTEGDCNATTATLLKNFKPRRRSSSPARPFSSTSTHYVL